MNGLSKLLGPMARRIGNMIARGIVTATNPASKLRTLQLRLLAGEVKDGVEHFEPYGYTSEPHPGAEHVTVFLDGDRSHGITLVVADRRYRLTGLRAGEVALRDDLGQKIHLTRDGIVLDGAGLPITVQNTSHLTLDTPSVSTTGNLAVAGNVVAQGDVSDHGNKTMAAMRAAYNGHKHPGGGVPDAPM